MRAEYSLLLLPLWVELSSVQQSQGIHMLFHLMVELPFLSNEKGVKSSRVKNQPSS